MKIERPQDVHDLSRIGVLDAGGQYCHLIARKVRELGVYAEILPLKTPSSALKEFKGIIISGGPASVFAENRPDVDRSLFDLDLPVLGICYGHQVMATALGGTVRNGGSGEYGTAHLEIKDRSTLLKSLGDKEVVWMNHRDVVDKLPAGFEVIAETDDCGIAAMADPSRGYYGLQFHPEVIHTSNGKQILRNFVEEVCGCPPGEWDPKARIPLIMEDIRAKVGADREVFFLVSGGVDSTVAFALCVMALGKERVSGLYVNTGFMRRYDNEAIDLLIAAGMDNLHVIDASEEVLGLLDETWDPEEKREKIGLAFMEITERELEHTFKRQKENWVLGQGTIYPDTIESGGTEHAARIKTHHNRVTIVQKMIDEGRVVEPIHELYKDEVRAIGVEIAAHLGLPERLIFRHPFPGPGLAIRCLASPKTVECFAHDLVQAAAAPYGLTHCALDVRTVGVKGDERSYDKAVALAGTIPSNLIADLEPLSTAITNTASDINRVTYCLTEQELRPEEWSVKRAFLSRDRIELLREADARVMKFLERNNLLTEIWQFPVILIPLMKNNSGGDTVVLRPVDSIDGMTAKYSRLAMPLLHELASELMSLVGIDAVLLDVTNKPPATIEWE